MGFTRQHVTVGRRLDVPRTTRVEQSIVSLLPITAEGRNVDNHSRTTVTAQRLFQQTSQLTFTVGNKSGL
jgi:hypothetical protein